MVTSERMRFSPGVKISSASTETGYSLSTSGFLLTRVCPRPIAKPLPFPGVPRVVALPVTGMVNIAPPRLSMLPLMTLMASTNHALVVPNSTVFTPMRPYKAAVGAPAISRAKRTMTSAATPVASATNSGVNGATAARNSSSPFSTDAMRDSIFTKFSANITLAIADKNNPSVPGRIDTHSSAASAVRVRRGSTTTTFPPRARMASMRPGKSGAVHRLPFDA